MDDSSSGARRLNAHSIDRKAWSVVRGRLGLSAEAKLVWEEIWQRADGRPQTMQCHPAAIGSLFGAEDPLRSGKRSLQALSGIGLIELVETGRGNWVFFVNDPLEVEEQRLRRISDHGQRELFEEPEEAPLPEEPAVISLHNLSRGQPDAGTHMSEVGPGPANLSRGQHPAGTQTGGDCAMTAGLEGLKPLNWQPPPVFSAVVAQSPPIPTSKTSKYEDQSTSNLNFRTSEVQKPTGGGCATTADARRLAAAGLTNAEAARAAVGLAAERQAKERCKDGPEPLGGMVDLVLKRVEGRSAAQAGDAAALAKHIFDRVGHPRLMRCICERIAWAIVHGTYPREKLEGILTQTDGQRAKGRQDLWVYFVGVMKHSFRQHGAGELTKPAAATKESLP